MQRREFIKQGCTACLSMTVLSTLVSSCVATKYISGELGKDGLTISKDEFKVQQKGGTAYWIMLQWMIRQLSMLAYGIYRNLYL